MVEIKCWCETNQIEKKVKLILERLEEINGDNKKIIGSMDGLLRQKSTNKMAMLENEVMRKKEIRTFQVMKLLCITRPHALNLMRKLDSLPGFKFILGDSKFKRSSKIYYKPEEVFNVQCKAIMELLSKTAELSLRRIMDEFNISIEQARYLTERVELSCPERYKFQENKLVRLLTNSGS